MTRILTLVAAMAAVAVLGSQAHAQSAIYDITVTADKTKANGSPWDGIPRLGNSKLNLNAAPDIAVCVARANAKPDCIWRPDGQRLFSICQNQWTCRFPGVALGPLPVGVVLIDIDARNHDIIDTLVLTDKEDGAGNAAIAESLRTAMSVLTPHRSEDSKEHIVRDAKIVRLKDCASGNPCRLTQSDLKLELRK